MYRSLKISIFISFIFLIACSEESSYPLTSDFSQKKIEDPPQQPLDSPIDTTPVFPISTIRLDYLSGYQIIEGVRKSEHVTDTTELTSDVVKAFIRLPFSDFSICNYSNTTFLFDGMPLQGNLEETSYGVGFVAENFINSYDKPHTLSIYYDSLLCGNIKETHVLVPSDKLGKIDNPEIKFSPQIFKSIKNNFFITVLPAFYSPSYTVWGDTINTKCFLKTPEDSLQLNLFFDKLQSDSSSYPHAVVSADSASIEKVLKGDTIAILSCALVYKTWVNSCKIVRPNYYNRKIKFFDFPKQRVATAYLTNEKLIITAPANTNEISKIWTRRKINDEVKYESAFKWYDRVENNEKITVFKIENLFLDSIVPTENDSLQIIISFGESSLTTKEEFYVRQQFGNFDNYLKSDDTVALAKLFDSVIDSNGSILPQYYYFDAIRILGYKQDR